ncbi:glycosyltransferase [Marinobacter oulmenensis]|uniref:Glycosyltransferase involved in cell wall biosynthesis n=1 Tax=Marinobacter oulmenensis TaxID=643747 RepID=A0A840UNM6_9GAMM|nr:glycosyltransferase [Marinobacter oulmenensis]MBB5322238.1 glycosyltransferase involved in cell wall biosynthesis [Marinobacter oulmenensis]
MRVMQILLSQSQAGAETYFEKVAAAIAQDPSITQKVVIEALPPREQRLDNAGVDYFTLPMGKLSKPLLYDWKLKSIVRDFKPDLIVTWVNRASRKCPPTSAVVVGRLGGYYDLKNYQKCDHLIVNTQDLVRHVTDNGWPADHVSMISNFGELPSRLSVPAPKPVIPEGHRVLLALGRLHEKKAHDTLIKALPDIPDTTLLIAGTGELQGQLEQLAEELQVSDRVQFLGLRKDIQELFDLTDVCVFPSRFEPLGNVVLEAWATRTPIVAAASQGPSWLITDGEDGRLFEVDSSTECARAVNQVLADDGLARRLAENGHRVFLERFSKDVIVDQYKALFQRLVNERQARASNPADQPGSPT